MTSLQRLGSSVLGLCLLLCMVFSIVLLTRTTAYATPFPQPHIPVNTANASATPTATPDPHYPTNTPCYADPPGIVIGRATPMGPPVPTTVPVGTPGPVGPTPPPDLPTCQWTQPSSDDCQGWNLDLPLGASICIAWKEWLAEIFQAFAFALGSAAQTAFTWVQGALTYTPDLTSYTDLASLYESMQDLGSVLFIGFFMLATIRYLLTSLGADSFYEATGAMRRGVVGAVLLQALSPLLHSWFFAVNAIAQAINSAPAGANIGTFAGNVLGIESLVAGTAGLLAPEVLVAAIILSLVFLLFIAAITVMRLTGLFVLACLYVIAPVCLVTWISPEFKAIAKWWFASFVTYSLWGIGYALVLKVDVILLTTSGGPPSDGTSTGKAVLAALMGLAGLQALWRVPRIMDSLLGGLASSHAGVSALPSMAMRYLGRIGG